MRELTNIGPAGMATGRSRACHVMEPLFVCWNLTFLSHEWLSLWAPLQPLA
jgi:hypothetical protein